jgi:nicotinamide-nucleotide amidase
LEHAVIRLLAAQHKTLATAEWGSGGMIANWLSNVTGSRDHFLGGIVANTSDFPGPSLETINDIDPALPPAAKRAIYSAKVCREKFDSDYGLSVGQLPIVDPQTAEPPLLYFAVAGPEKVTVKSSPYAGHPDILKMRGGKQALNLLRLVLLHPRH